MQVDAFLVFCQVSLINRNSYLVMLCVEVGE